MRGDSSANRFTIISAMTSSVPPINPRNQDYRIGDAERQKAMDDLGKHFAAGRLDITEYDNRLTNVAEATMRSDLIPIFSDLPAITDANTPVTIPHATGIPDGGHIHQQRNRGKLPVWETHQAGDYAAHVAPLPCRSAYKHAYKRYNRYSFSCHIHHVVHPEAGAEIMASTKPPHPGTPAATANRPGPGHAGAGPTTRQRPTNGTTTSPPATTTSRNHRRRPGSD